MKRTLTEKVFEYISTNETKKAKGLMLKQDFHVIARVVNNLHAGKSKAFALLPPEIQAEVLLLLTRSTKHGCFHLGLRGDRGLRKAEAVRQEALLRRGAQGEQKSANCWRFFMRRGRVKSCFFPPPTCLKKLERKASAK